MSDAFLREILKLLILIAMALGVVVPPSATDLLNPPAPIPTPTIEYAPIQNATFTPHTGYVINLRAECGRAYPILSKINYPVIVDGINLVVRDGFVWAYVASGGCIAIKQGNVTFGTLN